MRTLSNTVLIGLLSVTLVGAPLLAAPMPATSPAAPLGTIIQATNAKQGMDLTLSGTTVYDGDRLQAPDNSTLQVQLGSGQMVLRPNATAQFHAFPNGFSADLAGGTVVVSSGAGQTFRLLADGATITPANAEPASGQITKVSAKELVLTGNRGVLKITMGDEVKTLEAGSSYRMVVDSDESDPGPQPQRGPSPTARNRFLWIIIPAVVGVTAIIVWRALVSPSSN